LLARRPATKKNLLWPFLLASYGIHCICLIASFAETCPAAALVSAIYEAILKRMTRVVPSKRAATAPPPATEAETDNAGRRRRDYAGNDDSCEKLAATTTAKKAKTTSASNGTAAGPVLKLDPPSCSCREEEEASAGTSDESSPPSSQKSLLSTLLFPLSADEFLSSQFRNRAVYSPAGANSSSSSSRASLTNRIRRQLFDLHAPSIFEATSSESIFVWLRSGNESGSGSGLIRSIEVSDPESARALLEAGHPTYCRAPPRLERYLVREMLKCTGFGCGQYEEATAQQPTSLGRGEVEVFVSTTAGHVTDWHYDFQENFTVQLSGTKRWTLQRGTVSHPVRGCTPHYRSPESVEPQLRAARLADASFRFGHPAKGENAVGDRDTVTMRPGDALYFPAGMWHKVEVVEPGVSINISLMATSYAEVACRSLQHLLMKRDEWRECVASNSGVDAAERLRALLQDLPRIVREFETRGGGAESVLPPIVRLELRQQEQRQQDRTTDEDGDEEVDDAELEEDDEADVVVDVCGDRSDNEDSDDDDDSGGGIRKQLPPPCQQYSEEELRVKSESFRIAKNPLATLLRESELRDFYRKKIPTAAAAAGHQNDREGDDGAEQSEVWVLSVNYAGNEAHECMVRVRIRDRGVLLGCIDAQKEHDTDGDWLPPLDKWVHSGVDRKMFACLLYYGLLVWVRR